MMKKLELLDSYKMKDLNILLHAPLHPSYWNYLIETMPEHDWFVEPKANFQEAGTPRDNIKYTVVQKNSKIKFDVQIICLSTHSELAHNIVKDFNVPIVFLDFHKWKVPKFRIKYPLISACYHTANKDYPNIKYNYVPPSKTLWNKKWEGDIPKVFIPAQRYLESPYAHTYFSKLIPKLQETDLNLEIVENKTRTIPWSEWQDFFIHNRVLLDCADKTSSFVLEEAMTIGMPVISRNMFESPYVIRDRIDGFLKWNEEELINILFKFTEDYSFAKKWSRRSKKRGEEVLSVEKTRKVFNDSFHNAIDLYNSTNDPFKR